jgi:Na+/H+ ion antiporter subunit
MRRPDPAALGEVAAWWTVLTALYLTFIATVTVLEFAVGAAGSALAAVAARAVRRAAGGGTGGRGGWLAALAAWPGAVLTDTLRLAATTARRLGGARRSHPVGRFATLRLTSGTGAAWTSALLSATPGAYVVEVTPAREAGTTGGDLLTVHLLPGEPTTLERVLTAGGRR